MTKQLILGGARCGKSRLAEQRAVDSGKELVYLATAFAGDEEMAVRIAHHKSRRSDAWTVVEEQIELVNALLPYNNDRYCILVDCLTLWLSNCLTTSRWKHESQRLLDALDTFRADLILVSNEVGSGIVPLGELNRQFVDESGRIHQALASRCNQVTLVVAGLPLELKQNALV